MSTSVLKKPTIIGFYGVSGSGKSHLLNKLKNDPEFKNGKIKFCDGSELLDEYVKGGIKVFQAASDEIKNEHRTKVLIKLVEELQATGQTAVIAGHYMLWEKEANANGEVVWVDQDAKTYTHMIYLRVTANTTKNRRAMDDTRSRAVLSEEHLRKWRKTENTQLYEKCLEHNILYTNIADGSSALSQLTALVKDFLAHDEATNEAAVACAVDTTLASRKELETILLLDADKTLTAQDTGMMFWKRLSAKYQRSGEALENIFKKQGYSYHSFRQATFLYESVRADFTDTCDAVAAGVTMYPKMIDLLNRAKEQPHVATVVVTCGVQHIWKAILSRHELSHVTVIGGGQLSDGYVVTDTIKGRVVDQLHSKDLRVVAFGDSPLDIHMLEKADEAYVVVGEVEERSKKMNALAKDLSAEQILFPDDVAPRLGMAVAHLDAANISRILRPLFVHATESKAALLLQTSIRNRELDGLDLRAAHKATGYYLAMSLLSTLLGVETYKIRHVNGTPIDGFRFRNEASTVIVPLMRGGEPMAFGVARAMRSAAFAHAKEYGELNQELLESKKTIILVDSVINSGKSIVDFMVPLRKDWPHVRVTVVAGVVQAKAVERAQAAQNDEDQQRVEDQKNVKSQQAIEDQQPAETNSHPQSNIQDPKQVENTTLAHLLRTDPNLSIVALRTSNNEYKGKGKTDTGHRLFNTTNLE